MRTELVVNPIHCFSDVFGEIILNFFMIIHHQHVFLMWNIIQTFSFLNGFYWSAFLRPIINNLALSKTCVLISLDKLKQRLTIEKSQTSPVTCNRLTIHCPPPDKCFLSLYPSPTLFSCQVSDPTAEWSIYKMIMKYLNSFKFIFNFFSAYVTSI